RAMRATASCWCRWSQTRCARSTCRRARSTSTCISWARISAMEIDVFTLFPDAFGWFEGQRHVANAIAHGNRLGYVNYRDHTPLNARQVDDTPFGGGAGMVLRVDVVDAALRARYGVDPVSLTADRRVIALTPSGRVLDDAFVDELAQEERLTLLSGPYEAFDQRLLDHFVSHELPIGPS